MGGSTSPKVLVKVTVYGLLYEKGEWIWEKTEDQNRPLQKTGVKRAHRKFQTADLKADQITRNSIPDLSEDTVIRSWEYWGQTSQRLGSPQETDQVLLTYWTATMMIFLWAILLMSPINSTNQEVTRAFSVLDLRIYCWLPTHSFKR